MTNYNAEVVVYNAELRLSMVRGLQNNEYKHVGQVRHGSQHTQIKQIRHHRRLLRPQHRSRRRPSLQAFS
jgi:hypothetical protein